MRNIQYTYRGKIFTITPERGTVWSLQILAKNLKSYVIGGFQSYLGAGVALISPEGEALDSRFKAVYPGFTDHSKDRKGDIRPFHIFTKEVEYGGDQITVLPLICYEIVFPKLWMSDFDADFITHHVGFLMFDVFQLEGWRALQEVVAIFYNCDVICACGGDKDTPMNLSGIVQPNRDIFNYKPLYKKYHGGHKI